MKVKSESEVAQSYLTRSDPIDCSLPGSSIHGIFQAGVLKWGAIAFSNSTYTGDLRMQFIDVKASLVCDFKRLTSLGAHPQTKFTD